MGWSVGTTREVVVGSSWWTIVVEANKICTRQQSIPCHRVPRASSCHTLQITLQLHTFQSTADMVGTNSSRDNRITLVAAASFAAGVVVASVVFRRREKRRRKVSRLNGEQTLVMADDSMIRFLFLPTFTCILSSGLLVSNSRASQQQLLLTIIFRACSNMYQPERR